MRVSILLLAIFFTSFNSFATQSITQEKIKWVDSVYQSMSLEERIGQLFMVAAYSGGPNENYAKIKPLVASGKVGGLIYMQGNVAAQIQQTNELQMISKVPILIGMDAEWGLGMRLTGVRDYPKQMTLGATRNPDFVEKMGCSIGKQLSNIGVHINFAPVVDINNNPLNPIINFRSFGEQKELVAQLGIAYMKGLEAAGITAVAKHFPGHGDVSVDSHHDLPIIKKSIQELEQFELYPFKKLIDKGLNGVLIAHLSVPSMDDRPNIPSTLSYPIITEWLRVKLGFKGLIFTDALNMQGVTKYFKGGEVDLNAFLAGNDVLLFSQNVEKGTELIMEAYADGRITEQRLASSVRRILAAKYDHGLSHFKPIEVDGANDLANSEVERFLKQASELSLTLWKGEVAGHKPKENKVLHLLINQKNNYQLQRLWSHLQYEVTTVYINNDAAAQLNRYNIDDYDQIIVSVHAHQNYPGRSKLYGINASDLKTLQKLKHYDKVYVGILGNVYLANQFCDFKNIMIAYESNEFTMTSFMKAVYGGWTFKGKSPVSICH